MTSKPVISPMTVDDLEAVVDIEAMAYRAPWSKEIFTEELAREWARLVVARSPAGRQSGDCKDSESLAVIGYCNYWIVRDEFHLLNIAVAPPHRGVGVGAALMEYLLDQAKSHGARLITLEVRKGNQVALRLYERMGFAPVGVRRRYYADNDEDAIVMLCGLRRDAPEG